MRIALAAAVATTLLVGVSPAEAHRAGRVAVAVDSRILSVEPASAGTATVDLASGRVTLAAGHAAIEVLGLTGEPMLRFHDGLVEVSLASPSARLFGIVGRDPPLRGWRVVAHSTSFGWHDERAVPLPAAFGTAGPGWHAWRIPLIVQGHAGGIAGVTRLAPDPSRLWIVGPVVVAILLGAAAWNGRRRGAMLAVTATISAVSGVIAVAGLAGGSRLVVAATGLLVLAGSLVLLGRFRSRTGRLAVSATLGMAGVLVGSGTIEVLAFGVPLSSLSPEIARLATATALATALTAVGLAGREVIASGMFDGPPS